MSDIGIFEVAAAGETERQRQQRIAADKLAAAIYDVDQQVGPFLRGAKSVSEFRNRVALAKRDIRDIVVRNGVPPRKGIMRRICAQLERDWRATTKIAENGDKKVEIVEVESTFVSSDGPLKPEGDFKGYLDRVDQDAESKVDHLFTGEGTEHTKDPDDTDFAKKGGRTKRANGIITDRDLQRYVLEALGDQASDFDIDGIVKALGEHVGPYPLGDYPGPDRAAQYLDQAVSPEAFWGLVQRNLKASAVTRQFLAWCRKARVAPTLDALDRFAAKLPTDTYFKVAGTMQRLAKAGAFDRRLITAAPDYLQKANDALTGLLNQKAEEFQESIAPLQQALVIVQQALAEQQANAPFSVMPGGQINVMPEGTGAQGGAPAGGLPMDPAAMGGGMPPMDPAAMGGVPPQMMMASRHKTADGMRFMTPHEDPYGYDDIWEYGPGRRRHDPWDEVAPGWRQNLDLDYHLITNGTWDVTSAVNGGYILRPGKFPSDIRYGPFENYTDAIAYAETLPDPVPPTRTAAGKGKKQRKGDVLTKFDQWQRKQPQRGSLPTGTEADIDQFVEEVKVGPRALQKLKKHLNPTTTQEHEAAIRTAAVDNSGHTVDGWEWDDYLMAHVASAPKKFACSCGHEFSAPSGFHRCACGKQWNSYVIGTGGDRHEASASRYLVREIPVRENVIVASKAAPGSGRTGTGDDFARFVAEAYTAREAALHDITQPGGTEPEDGQDPGTPTMKKAPKDWAKRDPAGRWTANRKVAEDNSDDDEDDREDSGEEDE